MIRLFFYDNIYLTKLYYIIFYSLARKINKEYFFIFGIIIYIQVK